MPFVALNKNRVPKVAYIKNQAVKATKIPLSAKS